jgi:hypothetical protein
MSKYEEITAGKSAIKTYKNHEFEVDILKSDNAMSLLFDLIFRPKIISSSAENDKDVRLLEKAGFITVTADSILPSPKGLNFLALLNISKQDIFLEQQEDRKKSKVRSSFPHIPTTSPAPATS